MINILTSREKEIINKKLAGSSLTQNESNILSKYIRPKLKRDLEAKGLNSQALLNKLEYNQKSKSIENEIKRLILHSIEDVKAIILHGSAIQTNYKNYNDIDVLIITKNKTWKVIGEKYERIVSLNKEAERFNLSLDIQILDEKTFYATYSSSPSLIYQLSNNKIIYGSIKIPKKRELSKLDLRMKLDWSDIDDEESKGSDLYQSLRNIILVRLLMQKVIDNDYLREYVKKEIGNILASKLKSNTASKLEKKVVLSYIKELSNQIDKEIKEAKWEKIVL